MLPKFEIGDAVIAWNHTWRRDFDHLRLGRIIYIDTKPNDEYEYGILCYDKDQNDEEIHVSESAIRKMPRYPSHFVTMEYIDEYLEKD